MNTASFSSLLQKRWVMTVLAPVVGTYLFAVPFLLTLFKISVLNTLWIRCSTDLRFELCSIFAFSVVLTILGPYGRIVASSFTDPAKFIKTLGNFHLFKLQTGTRIEQYLLQRYGIELSTFWSRLFAILPSGDREQVADKIAQLSCWSEMTKRIHVICKYSSPVVAGTLAFLIYQHPTRLWFLVVLILVLREMFLYVDAFEPKGLMVSPIWFVLWHGWWKLRQPMPYKMNFYLWSLIVIDTSLFESLMPEGCSLRSALCATLLLVLFLWIALWSLLVEHGLMMSLEQQVISLFDLNREKLLSSLNIRDIDEFADEKEIWQDIECFLLTGQRFGHLTRKSSLLLSPTMSRSHVAMLASWRRLAEVMSRSPF